MMRSSSVLAVVFIFAFAAFLTSMQYWPTEQPQISLEKKELPSLPEAGPIKEEATSSSILKDAAQTEPIVITSTSTPIIKELPTVPSEIRAIYLTGCVAGSSSRRRALIPRMQSLGINAVIFDIKDYSGYVSYKMPKVPEVAAIGADAKVCIGNVDSVLKEFHENEIYVIGRITVFQDPVFAFSHFDLALKNEVGGLWNDNKGLEWLDPAGESTWLYIESIAKDAFARGFDEVNFDYIRFPSDGQLNAIRYPFYNQEEPRSETLRRFFEHLRKSLEGERISADLFGYTTSVYNDLGIGQILEKTLPYFDYVSPMIYPSHFYSGSYSIQNPADEPYEIIRRAMLDGLYKYQTFTSKNPEIPAATFRPWLQAFDMGAVYDKQKIDAQVRGLNDAFAGSPEVLNGWMFWDPSNLYLNL